MSNLESFPYPSCPNNNEAKSVCLHQKCEIFPFFCSTCDEELCELKHQHSNKITSISFRQFIKHVQQLKRPFPDLVQACNIYSKTLLEFQSKVSAFILKQLKQIETMKNKPPPLPQKHDQLVKKILGRQYKDLRGKDTDIIWMLRPNKPVDEIGYIQSKTEQIQSLAQDFKKLIALLTENQEGDEHAQTQIRIQSLNVEKSEKVPQLIKIQQQNQSLQKLLKQKQNQVAAMEESIHSLSKQNQQLILSRDQMMGQFIQNNNKKRQPVDENRSEGADTLKQGIRELEKQQPTKDKEEEQPKSSERSEEVPEHKGGRI